MDKYKRVIKPKEKDATKDDEEIRVTAVGSVAAYVSRAATVFGELAKPKVVIKAQGNALTKAVTAAEVIKRRFKGLHQVTSIGQTEIVDEFEPLEEGLDKVTQTRHIPFVQITLSKEALDSNDKGYQAPIDESLVKEMDDEELKKPRGRGGGRGKGRGKGRGRGKGKGKGKGKGDSKGKGKGKGDSKGKGKGKGDSKGKGKGKGKEESSKGKGKGKGKDTKGKGKGKEAPSKGKGSKGKGKSDSKGKSKGKGKSSYSYDNDWYGSSKGYSKGSKGKGKSNKGWW